MSASEDRYRLTLELWASRYVPEGATDLDVTIVEDPGYKYSSYTFEDPHVDVDIHFTHEGRRQARSVEVESLGDLLHTLFAIEETPMTATPFDQPSTLKGSPDPEGGDGAYSVTGKKERYGRYLLPDPESGKPTPYTRATTFAKSISDTYALSMWGLRMGGYGLTLRGDLYARMASTSLADKDTQNSIMEEAKNAAGSKVGANLGTALHAFSEAVDRGEEPNIPPPYRPHLKAYSALLTRYNLEILDIEKVVLNATYGIAGTFDRIVRFTKDTTVDMPGGGTYTFKNGTIATLDLKTGKDLSYGWLEISIQLAIYANAEWIFDKETKAYRLMPPDMNREVALVVHLPATAPGESVKATMYAVDIAAGWELAKLCADVREARKRKNLATALSVVEEAGVEMSLSADQARVHGTKALDKINEDVVRPPTLLERANTARTVDDLAGIWFEAVRSRQDKPDLAAAIKARKASLLADSAAG